MIIPILTLHQFISNILIIRFKNPAPALLSFFEQFKVMYRLLLRNVAAKNYCLLILSKEQVKTDLSATRCMKLGDPLINPL